MYGRTGGHWNNGQMPDAHRDAKTVTTLHYRTVKLGRDEDESPVLYVMGEELGTSLLVPSITNISMSLLSPDLWKR